MKPMDYFRLWLPTAAAARRPAATARPVMSTLKAWLDVARGPIVDDEAVWPRLDGYPYGPAPR